MSLREDQLEPGMRERPSGGGMRQKAYDAAWHALQPVVAEHFASRRAQIEQWIVLEGFEAALRDLKRHYALKGHGPLRDARGELRR